MYIVFVLLVTSSTFVNIAVDLILLTEESETQSWFTYTIDHTKKRSNLLGSFGHVHFQHKIGVSAKAQQSAFLRA